MNLSLVTHFDINYAARAIAMISSAERNSSQEICWKVLALDLETFDLLKKLDAPNIQIFNVEQIGPELKMVQISRTHKEFCWSAGAIFLDFVLKNNLTTPFVGYIDADCYFFGDISSCISELGNDKNIAAHAHNFSKKRQHWEKSVGKFNVGLVIGRKSTELAKCIQTWKDEVLESCTSDTSTGNFGDQKYLDSWPIRYKGFVELRSRGVGLAPWNIDHLKLSNSRSGMTVNNDDLIFYHFHGVHQVIDSKFCTMLEPARGYTITRKVRQRLYLPYIRELLTVANQFGIQAFPESSFVPSKLVLRNLYFTFFFKLKKKLIAII